MLRKFGLNQPPQPIRSFEASDVLSGFQYLQSDERIGRVIITMPQNCKELDARSLPSQISLRSDRTYVIVGGLGGLGQATARFLVEKGARHLMFFSRSAEEYAKCHPEYFKELDFLGCNVQAISGSVSELADVVRMVESAHTPVAGVLHAAMILQVIFSMNIPRRLMLTVCSGCAFRRHDIRPMANNCLAEGPRNMESPPCPPSAERTS
jgi:hypothetical protein